ncbi:MAG: D-alanyl-D-alanine carboxypeptidase [Candidatus Binatia bacterium]|nr:D-alanyl-D-alanine carboxypeptidase [Candidatus Binatia bacterium]
MRRVVLGVVVFVLCSGTTAFAAPEPTPDVGGIQPYRGAILVEMGTGKVLFAENDDLVWPPASMVKIMTVLVVMDAVAAGEVSLDDPVTASKHAEGMGGTQVWLAAGERFPLRALLEAVLVGSANDAAVAVAEHVAGDVPSFVGRMNAKAAALGMNETELQSVHGLPPSKGQTVDLTSPRDLAKAATALRAYPEIWKWASTKEAPFRDGKFTLRTTNWLLHWYPGITGLKTGFINLSGFGVTATAERDGLALVAVVMGAAGKRSSLGEASRLLDYGFAAFRIVEPVKQGADVGAEISVSGGTEPFFRGRAADGIRMLISQEEAQGLAVEVRVPGQLPAPITQGQVVGAVVLKRGEEEVGRVDVLAPRNIESVGLLGGLW